MWVRPTPDVTSELMELVPLTMTSRAFGGASLLYTEYPKNMKVAASLTLPIWRGGELWGLIACHHHSGPEHVPHQVRAACEFCSKVVSLQRQASQDREHLVYRLRIYETPLQLVA